MNHDEHPEGGAQAEQNEPLFGGGVVRVVEKQGELISEDAPGFFEGDSMLALVLGVLPRVPLEPERPPCANVRTAYV
jgi:hypothetical protein